MKKFVYPAVLYTSNGDETEYMLNIEDLDIFSYGATMEEVCENSQSALTAYVSCCLRFGMELSESTSYEEFQNKYPNKTIMLIEAWFDEKDKAVTISK